MITDTKEKDSLLYNWYNFRQQLETSDTPFEDVAEYFLKKPQVRYYTDPYDQKVWPTPWELITENEYCPFNLILGICYTLQLTERFKDIKPTINISLDTYDNEVYYLLIINENVFGLNEEWISLDSLPETFVTKNKIAMESIH